MIIFVIFVSQFKKITILIVLIYNAIVINSLYLSRSVKMTKK